MESLKSNASSSLLSQVVRTAAELRRAVAAARETGKRVGLVPTMGALHAGHLSLVEAARRECDFTIVTIFVNPTQFAPGEDFNRYPRTIQADLSALAPLAPDLVFVPSLEEMYPPGHATLVDVAGPAEPLEGRYRPGHFRGVATIVLKLFHMATPEVAFFGQKDYQQALVVRRMVEDLNLPIEIRVCPIVREPDGLAMSSRNAYLDPQQRQEALVLSRGLRLAADLAAGGELRAAPILRQVRELFAQTSQVRLEYFALVDPDTLADVQHLDEPALAAVAAWVGSTRLIDNQRIGAGASANQGGS